MDGAMWRLEMFWRDVKGAAAEIARMPAWVALLLAVGVSGLFSYLGPRQGDDMQRAVRLAVAETWRKDAIKACNEEAVDGGDKVRFAENATSASIVLQKSSIGNPDEAVITLQQKDDLCYWPINGDATIANVYDTLEEEPDASLPARAR